MCSTKKRLSLFAVVGSVVAIVAVAAAPPSQPASAGANEIVGTWRAAVSGAPGFPDFFSLMVFDKRNTMTERVSVSPEITMGSGVWENIVGDDDANVAIMFELFSDEELDGVFDTRFRVRGTFQVDDDTLTGTATVDVLTLDGTTLLDSIPGLTLEGTRMTVIRE